MSLLTTAISPARQITFNPARNTDSQSNLSLTNTRDNFVRHALTHKTCPICAKPLVVGQRVFLACRCGFTVGQAESEHHRAAMLV